MDRERFHWGWAVAATLAVHTLLAVGIDAAGVLGGGHAYHPPPPHIELVDIDVPPPPPPEIKPEPPPPPEAKPLPPPPAPKQAPRPTKAPPALRTPAPAPVDETPPPETPPPPSTAPVDPGAGGEPYVMSADAVPGAHGPAVVPGRRNTTTGGRGGSGGGTGPGQGTGVGPGAQPVSVATIKKKAMPRGDYDYFDARKDYPAAAAQLQIEGQIKVSLVVDATGKVVRRTLVSRLGHGLDELALKRAGELQFDPAIDSSDKPVASVVVWTFTFTLPR